MVNISVLTAQANYIEHAYKDVVRSIYVNEISDNTLFDKAIKVYVYFKNGTKVTRIITENELRPGTVPQRKQFLIMLEEMISAAKEKKVKSYRCAIKRERLEVEDIGRRGYWKVSPIKNVIFNDPATIVLWTDGTKTVVKAHDEPYDPEKGLAMAIAKKHLGNQGNYYNTFSKWLPDNSDDSHVINDGYDALQESCELIVDTIKSVNRKLMGVKLK